MTNWLAIILWLFSNGITDSGRCAAHGEALIGVDPEQCLPLYQLPDEKAIRFRTCVLRCPRGHTLEAATFTPNVERFESLGISVPGTKKFCSICRRNGDSSWVQRRGDETLSLVSDPVRQVYDPDGTRHFDDPRIGPRSRRTVVWRCDRGHVVVEQWQQ